MDRARNALARTAAQIRTGHWLLAVFLKRTKRRRDDNCWFCHGLRMSKSHVFLHRPNAKLRAAREETLKDKDPGGIRMLLNNPRWEWQLLLTHLFIILATTPPSRRDMWPRKRKRKRNNARKSSDLGCALCASLGVRAPLTNLEKYMKEETN